MSAKFHAAIYRAAFLIQTGCNEREAFRTVKEMCGLTEDQMITLKARVQAQLQLNRERKK